MAKLFESEAEKAKHQPAAQAPADKNGAPGQPDHGAKSPEPAKPKGRTTTRGLDDEIKALATIYGELADLEDAEPGAGDRVLDWINGKWKRRQAKPQE